MRPAERIRRGWLSLIRHTLNRVTGRAAETGRGPFSMVYTVGRKTGRPYSTPIIAQPVEGAIVVELTYGPSVNWYRNAIAAGGCEVLRHGVRYTIRGIEPVPARQGLAAFPVPQRWVLRLLRRQHFATFLIAERSGAEPAAIRTPPARTIGRIALGAMLIGAGLSHLGRGRRGFRTIVPDWVPLDPDTVVVASGLAEIVLGGAILRPGARDRARTGWVAAAFFILVFPANVSQFTARKDSFGLTSDRARAVRLLFQPALVAWALWATRAKRAE